MIFRIYECKKAYPLFFIFLLIGLFHHQVCLEAVSCKFKTGPSWTFYMDDPDTHVVQVESKDDCWFTNNLILESPAPAGLPPGITTGQKDPMQERISWNPEPDSETGTYNLVFRAYCNQDPDKGCCSETCDRNGCNVDCENVKYTQNFTLTIAQSASTSAQGITVEQQSVSATGFGTGGAAGVKAKKLCRPLHHRKGKVRYENIVRFDRAEIETDIVEYRILVRKIDSFDQVLIATLRKKAGKLYKFRQRIKDPRIGLVYTVQSVNSSDEIIGSNSFYKAGTTDKKPKK